MPCISDSPEYRALHSKVEDLSHQIRALATCLVNVGVVSSVQLQVQQHRLHFRAACQHSSWSPDTALLLSRVFGIEGVGLRISRFVGEGSCVMGHMCKDALAAVHQYAVSLYMFGGTSNLFRAINTVMLLDPPSVTWEPLPRKMPLNGSPVSATVINGRAYVCGLGFEGLAGIVLRFNPWADGKYAWKTMPVSRTLRTYTAVAALAGKLYMCGGRNTSVPEVLRSAECFDPVHGDAWEQLPPMTEMRMSAACAPFAGQLLVCGGHSAHVAWQTSIMSSAEVYDPHLRRWTDAPSMLVTRDAHCAVAIGNRVLVVGGYSADSYPNSLRSIEMLHPESTTWSAMAPMLVPRASAAATVVGQKVYIFGGVMCDPEMTNTNNLLCTECFDLESGTWERWINMPYARRSHACVVLAKHNRSLSYQACAANHAESLEQ